MESPNAAWERKSQPPKESSGSSLAFPRVPLRRPRGSWGSGDPNLMETISNKKLDVPRTNSVYVYKMFNRYIYMQTTLRRRCQGSRGVLCSAGGVLVAAPRVVGAVGRLHLARRLAAVGFRRFPCSHSQRNCAGIGIVIIKPSIAIHTVYNIVIAPASPPLLTGWVQSRSSTGAEADGPKCRKVERAASAFLLPLVPDANPQTRHAQ